MERDLAAVDPAPLPLLAHPQLLSAQRQALATQIGRTGGNRHLQRVLASVQRDENGNGTEAGAEEQPADAAPARTFKNARFQGSDALLAILRGEAELSRSHNGDAVRRVQQALYDMAYPLPRYRVDGKIGSETREAIRRFNSDHSGGEGDLFDASSMAALDRAAPPPGVSAAKTVDYSRLLADDRLTFTFGIGYGQHGDYAWHEEAAEEMRTFLLDEGFAGQSMQTGLEVFTKPHAFSYIDPNSGEPLVHHAEVEIKLVTPHTQGAKEAFGQGLSESDIAIYTGHARYGTGPDFDASKSPAENFTIGVGSALHKAGKLKSPPGEDASWYRGHRDMARVLDKRANDLQQMAAEGKLDPEKYQVWFFDACTTLHYLDELRSPEIMGEKGRESLDIIGTRHSILMDNELKSAQIFIRSVLSMQTLDQLMAAMEGAMEDEKEGMFFHEGFGDNPTATTHSESP